MNLNLNLNRIGKGLSKRSHDYFVPKTIKNLYINHIREKCREFNCKPLTSEQIDEIKGYYGSFGFTNVCMDWHRFYTHITGKFYREYIPEDFYYNIIIPSLNMRKMYPGLLDKNILNQIFPDVLKPEVIVKNVNGLFLDSSNSKLLSIGEVKELFRNQSKYIIKPSIDSGGGKNVVVFDTIDGKTSHKDMTIPELISSFKENFVVQKFLVQHERMNILNPTSVNSLRLKTLIINNRVELIKGIVRIGGLNSTVDNIMRGGIYCKVQEDGKLVKLGYNRRNDFIVKTQSGIELMNYQIPNYEKIVRKVKLLHLKVPHFKLVSWDIAISEEGEPVLLEYNTIGQGYSEEDGPIFGNYTDQVLRLCQEKS